MKAHLTWTGSERVHVSYGQSLIGSVLMPMTMSSTHMGSSIRRVFGLRWWRLLGMCLEGLCWLVEAYVLGEGSSRLRSERPS